MNNPDNCIFCKIVSGSIPASKIYEDDHALAFLDIEPKSPGHTLVIPKRHAPVLADLPEEEIGPLFTAVKRVSVLLSRKLKAEGLTIGVNQGEVSGQVVGHIHVHVMPRFGGDGGYSVQSVVDNKPKDSVEEIRKAISGN